MSKLKQPVLSFGASGSLGAGLTLTRRRHTNIAEKKPIPKDAKSIPQLSWRTMFEKCTLLWHSLSTSEKRTWESLATPRHMTGYALWQSQCLRPNPGIYLPLQGGTMQGDIDMAKHRLLKLPAPTDTQEAARKAEVDAVTGEHSLAYWRKLNRYHFSYINSGGQWLPALADYLYAVPFYAPVNYTVTKIGIRVNTGAAGTARLGIYHDNNTIYPGNLLSDCGTIDVTTGGYKEILALSISLTANKLYWLAYVSDVTISLLALAVESSWGILGHSAPDYHTMEGSYFKAFSYASLPDPYPSTATLASEQKPAIGVNIT